MTSCLEQGVCGDDSTRENGKANGEENVKRNRNWDYIRCFTGGIYWGYRRIMENVMETTIINWGYVGFIGNMVGAERIINVMMRSARDTLYQNCTRNLVPEAFRLLE